MDAKINIAKQHLRCSFQLKPKQYETLEALYNERDCISILPTGYGKSLIFQALPWVLSMKQDRPGIAVIICPVTSLMQDQVMSLNEKGVRAAYLDMIGTQVYSFNCDTDSEEEDGDFSSQTRVISSNIDAIKSGDIELLYCHPEALFTSKFSKMLRSKVYQEMVCCIAVDEVHMVEEWGGEFRPKFQKIGELTGLFPNAAHLAVTATATQSSIQDLSKALQYINPAIIQINPDRPNLYLEIKPRLPNNNKFAKYDDIIKPIAEELKLKLENFPLTIIYVEGFEAMGYFYQYVNHELKEKQYKGDPIPENRIFGQYHQEYTKAMKQHIISELRKESPTLRLVLATVALGMGLDAPGITRIIHCRPPTTLEKYFQEIGRAGRKGQKATTLMYFNNNDLAKNRKGLSQAMVQYCKRNDKCLRLRLLEYFGFSETRYEGPPQECCSFCSSEQD